MGKNKLKNHKRDEDLQGISRGQRKLIKRLQQHIKQLEKQLGYRQNNSKELLTEEPELPKFDCPECGLGFLKEVKVLDRKLTICGSCKYRTRAIKV